LIYNLKEMPDIKRISGLRNNITTRIKMIPVITIDGPSGSGKGTIAAQIAAKFGFQILDSGALYRLSAYACVESGIDFGDVEKVVASTKAMEVIFENGKIALNGKDVTNLIRTETAGNNASKVAAIPEVRDALLEWQRNYLKAPGLVADGRDMGTVVFPDAVVKVFLTASAQIRADRRYKQLKEKGISANLRALTEEINERDDRDRNRTVAPLKPADDALELDSTSMTIEAVVEKVSQHAQALLKI